MTTKAQPRSKKKLATAALVGLMTVGSLSACTTNQGSSHNTCSANGCKSKKEAHGCQGKNGCSGSNSCEGKNGCNH